MTFLTMTGSWPVAALLFAMMAALVFFQFGCLLGLYHHSEFRFPQLSLKRVISVMTFSFVFLTAIILVTSNPLGLKPQSLDVFAYAVLGASLVSATRLGTWAVAQTLSRKGYLTRKVAVLASSDEAAFNALSAMEIAPNTRIIGAFYHQGRADDGIAGLIKLGWDANPDEIFIIVGQGDEGFAYPALKNLRAALSTVTLVLLDQSSSQERIRTCTIQTRPLSSAARIGKRLIDIGLSSLLLVGLAPLMLIIAVLVKLDSSGPALFCQQRNGFNKRPFVIFKFRSMHATCCENLQIRQVTRNDTRLTRIGSLLRASSLDELPQLVNVLLGDMSVIGPRPHPISLNDQYAQLIDNYFARQRVKPGITGWAQIHGFRGETATIDKMKRRVQLDIDYIERWSVFLDLKILMRTILIPLSDKNAY
jgi:putative colanic acid biosynthesis UDP-glucose lipid carrier transferase